MFELRYRRASARAASRTASSASALWNPRGLDGDIGMPAIRPREGQRPHRRGARAAVRGLCAYSRAFLAKKQIWPKPAPLFFMGPFLPCGTPRSRPRFGHVVVFHPPLFFRTPSPPIAHSRPAQHHASPAAKMATTVASLRVVAPASVASKRGGMLRTRAPGTSRRYTHRAVHIRVDRATTTWLVGRGRGRLPSSSFPVSLAGYHPTSGSMRNVPAVRCVYINTRGCCTPNTR